MCAWWCDKDESPWKTLLGDSRGGAGCFHLDVCTNKKRDVLTFRKVSPSGIHSWSEIVWVCPYSCERERKDQVLHQTTLSYLYTTLNETHCALKSIHHACNSVWMKGKNRDKSEQVSSLFMHWRNKPHQGHRKMNDNVCCINEPHSSRSRQTIWNEAINMLVRWRF